MNYYKDLFFNLINSKRREVYNFFDEKIINIDGKDFKYLEFNYDLDIINNSIYLAKEKIKYTMNFNQNLESRNNDEKLKNQTQGVLAEIFIHLLFLKRYDIEIIRYDLERSNFNYNKEEYDLKILIKNKEYKIEVKSSNILNGVEYFIKNDVIIGSFYNKIKNCEPFSDFTFRPIYFPKFNLDISINDILNKKVKLVITGMALKEEFDKFSYTKSLGQKNSTYYVIDAKKVGDITEMDRKIKQIMNK